MDSETLSVGASKMAPMVKALELQACPEFVPRTHTKVEETPTP